MITFRRRRLTRTSLNRITSDGSTLVALGHRKNWKEYAFDGPRLSVYAAGQDLPPVSPRLCVRSSPSFHHAIDELRHIRVAVLLKPVPRRHDNRQMCSRFFRPVSTIQISSSPFTTSVIARINKFVKKNST